MYSYNPKTLKAIEILKANPHNNISLRNDERTGVVWADDINSWGARTVYPDYMTHGVWDEIPAKDVRQLEKEGLIKAAVIASKDYEPHIWYRAAEHAPSEPNVLW